MITINVNVPDQTCENCPYLKPITIDHNYYGEKSECSVCKLFDTQILNNQKCSDCTKAAQDFQKAVNEIEHAVTEAHNQAVNKMSEEFKSIFIGKYLEGLINSIAERCKE